MNAVMHTPCHRSNLGTTAPYAAVLGAFVRQTSVRATKPSIAWSLRVSASTVAREVEEALALLEDRATAFNDVAELATSFAEMLAEEMRRAADRSQSDFVDPSMELIDQASSTRTRIAASMDQILATRRLLERDVQLKAAERRTLIRAYDTVVEAVQRADRSFERLIEAVSNHDEAVAAAKGIGDESIEEIVQREQGEQGMSFLNDLRTSEGNAAFSLARAREQFLKGH